MTRVALDGATKIYPRPRGPAFCDLDLTIEDGEFLVLVGPSGCGKSTARLPGRRCPSELYLTPANAFVAGPVLMTLSPTTLARHPRLAVARACP